MRHEPPKGFIVNISSLAGLRSAPARGFYNATKFAVEGLSGALWQEVQPLGIKVMVVEPSGFRTDWAGRSANESKNQIADYAKTAGAWRKELRADSGKQPGDPVRAVQALIAAVESAKPPRHLLLGNDAYAGAMSMAVGEYVSVSSQRDAEQADIGREKQELETEPLAELQELAMIYVKRGLEPGLASKVAEQLSAHDRLGSHVRDELGFDQTALARPLQAAWISAASFASFAIVPIVALLVAPAAMRIPMIAVFSLVSLAALGAFGGHLGGAPLGRAALRVTIGGALAMTVTAVIGRILGVSVGG